MSLVQRIMLKAEFFWFKPRKKMFKYAIIAITLWFTMPIVSYFLEYPIRWFPIAIYLLVSTIFFLALCSKTFVNDEARNEYKILEDKKSFNELFKK